MSGLPQLLRGDPGLALARAHSLSLQEEADIYVNQRKRSMIANGLIGGDSDSDDDDSSTTSSVSSHDTRTCTHCDRPVYGLVKQCSLHAPKAECPVNDADFQDALQRRLEQADRNVRSISTSQVKAETNRQSFPDAVSSTVTMSAFGARDVKSDTMPSLDGR